MDVAPQLGSPGFSGQGWKPAPGWPNRHRMNMRSPENSAHAASWPVISVRYCAANGGRLTAHQFRAQLGMGCQEGGMLSFAVMTVPVSPIVYRCAITCKKTLKNLSVFEGVEFALRYQEPSNIVCFDSCLPNVSAGDTSPIMHQNNSHIIMA